MGIKQTIAGNTPVSVLKRRMAGERAWRVEIEEVIASYRLMIQKVRAIRNLHPRDAELQGLAAEVTEGMVESLITLNSLYHYSDKEEGNNGKEGD